MTTVTFRSFFLLLLFLGITAFLPALAKKEAKNDAEQENVTPNTGLNVMEQNPLVQATGRVRLVGNEPFTELVITGENRDWHIERDEQYKLRDLQQRTVTVDGIETVTALYWASGLPAGERYYLKDIKILKLE